jgi:ribose 5-phosphate isomerase A
VKVVTPSSKTKFLCIKKGIEVLHTSAVNKITVAFDGCDEVDGNLNALKSGGGIHTKEKLIASMAEDYILLVDKSKFVKELDFKYPVVLEILQDSLGYVESMVKKLGGSPTLRTNSVKDGFIISDDGNLLMDVKFNKVEDFYELENNLKNICGVIDTSLFINKVSKVVVASEDGVRVVEK